MEATLVQERLVLIGACHRPCLHVSPEHGLPVFARILSDPVCHAGLSFHEAGGWKCKAKGWVMLLPAAPYQRSGSLE
jgi:hypothetical protein